MAASWTAGLPKLSMAMRGQTLRAWCRRTPSAVVLETFSAVVCRECLLRITCLQITMEGSRRECARKELRRPSRRFRSDRAIRDDVDGG